VGVDTDTLDSKVGGGDLLDDLDLDAALDQADDLLGGGAAGLDPDLKAALEADADQEEADGVQAYDFNRPHSISRVFEQNLQNFAEQVARLGTISFTNLLRASTVVEFEGIHLHTLRDYVQNMPNPTCAAVITLRPLNGQSLLNIDLGTCFVILKKLMGGRPDPEDRLRSFTEIERGIQTQFIGRINELLRNAASKLLEIRPEFLGLENNPNYLTGLPLGESVVCLRFKLKLETVEGPLDLCIPLPAFSSVRHVFDPEDKIELRSAGEVTEDRRQILDMLQSTTSEVVVELGEVEMTLEKVLSLNVGEILHLPQAVDSELRVLVEGKPVFLGQAGRTNQNRAVKLLRKLEEE